MKKLSRIVAALCAVAILTVSAHCHAQTSAPAFKTGVFSATVADNESAIKVEYPTEGPSALVDSIRVWVNQQLGDSFTGDLANVSAFAKHYTDYIKTNENIEFGGFEKIDIHKVFENDKIITFVHENEMYAGGAHGAYAKVGATFLKSNGKMLTGQMLTKWTAMRPLVLAGLKKYLDVKTNAQLREAIGADNVRALPKPYANPWIVANGLVVSYGQYEIGPYVIGSPTVVIPAATAKTYFNAQGQKFF